MREGWLRRVDRFWALTNAGFVGVCCALGLVISASAGTRLPDTTASGSRFQPYGLTQAKSCSSHEIKRERA
jgi:hypothetical protein